MAEHRADWSSFVGKVGLWGYCRVGGVTFKGSREVLTRWRPQDQRIPEDPKPGESEVLI